MASTLFTLGTTTYPTHHHHHHHPHRHRIATAKQPTMASFPTTAFPSVAKPGRVYATTTTAKSSGGGGSEEKSILDWILSGLQKEDQLLETDPILKKVEEKGSAGSRGKTAEAKKDGGGGFGGLFAKK
ncbi:hypothetical protein AKJ16_DCAP03956 [Drosera capensis]